jgi:hypothetical protein
MSLCVERRNKGIGLKNIFKISVHFFLPKSRFIKSSPGHRRRRRRPGPGACGAFRRARDVGDDAATLAAAEGGARRENGGDDDAAAANGRLALTVAFLRMHQIFLRTNIPKPEKYTK